MAMVQHWLAQPLAQKVGHPHYESLPVLVEGAKVKARDLSCPGLNAHAVEGGGCRDDCCACLQHVPFGHVQQVQPVVA